MKCWAAALGECGGGKSAEHLVSKCLFDGDRVSVVGFPWCREQAIEIQLSDAVANILCRNHNSALSPIDAVGGRLFSTLAEVKRLQDVRLGLGKRTWNVITYPFAGTEVERWVLKSTISLFYAGDPGAVWWPTRMPAISPPNILVEAAFGRATLPPPMGLYNADAVGGSITFAKSVRFSPVFAHPEALVGAFFEFRGFRFLMWCHEDAPAAAGFELGWDAGRLIRHPRNYRFTIRGKLSQRVRFIWPKV